MLVTCPACKKQHRVEHTNIPSQAQKARCSASSAIFPLQILTEKTGQHEVGATRQRRISVAISKGGVGKTTTAVNLAAGLACNGQKTLLIDTDTQGQDSFHLGVHPKKAWPTSSSARPRPMRLWSRREPIYGCWPAAERLPG